jgi:hypothetical protein
MEKLVESLPIIMKVTLYVALGVNPGALEITLDSGKLSEAPKSYPGAEVERGDVVLHTRT